MSILSIKAHQIYDSRGSPTVEVELRTALGIFHAHVPSGVSIGVHEAVELRDGTLSHRGKGVLNVINTINDFLGPSLVQTNYSVLAQADIDQYLIDLDGTKNKSRFGANAILGISIAVCKAGAAQKGIPLYEYIAAMAGNKNIVLPVPAFNVISGGIHAGNRLAIQEFMIMPIGAKTFAQAMEFGTDVYSHLKDILEEKYGSAGISVRDEGGFTPNLESSKEAFELIEKAIQRADLKIQVKIAIDVAASQFLRKKKEENHSSKYYYDLNFKNPKNDKSAYVTAEQLADIYKEYVKEYQIISIEDPFDQDDWKAWSSLNAAMTIQIVGDSLTVSNTERISKAIEYEACNCLLLKVNQIGTVTEAIKAHLMAKRNGWGTMVSHRAGDTDDTFIADLVVGLSTGQISAGAPCRSEHLAKYNQILRIERELREYSRYAGYCFRYPSQK